jgi:hypothetical protein
VLHRTRSVHENATSQTISRLHPLESMGAAKK